MTGSKKVYIDTIKTRLRIIFKIFISVLRFFLTQLNYLDKSMFGQVNSPYDFAFRDPAKAEKALRKGLKEKDKLTGQINQRAMALLAQAEKQYNELLEKRADVENDLDNIRNSMKMLDEKKKEKITSAYHEVRCVCDFHYC